MRRLVPALLEAGRDLELVVFAGDEGAPSLAKEPWAPDVELVHVPVRSRSRTRRVLVEQAVLPRAARKARLDLLHNVQNTAPAMPARPAGDDDPRRDLQAPPGDARGRPGGGRRTARPAGRAPLAEDPDALRGREGRHRPLPAASSPTRIDVTPLGPGLARRRAAGRGGRAPPAPRARGRADRVDRLGQAAAQEPRAAARGDGARGGRSRAGARRSRVRDRVRARAEAASG